jgi:hypothetical protein
MKLVCWLCLQRRLVSEVAVSKVRLLFSADGGQAAALVKSAQGYQRQNRQKNQKEIHPHGNPQLHPIPTPLKHLRD